MPVEAGENSRGAGRGLTRREFIAAGSLVLAAQAQASVRPRQDRYALQTWEIRGDRLW